MEKINLLKIKKTPDSLDRLRYFSSSRSFIENTSGFIIPEELTIKKLFDGVQSGKIAIFPIWKNQETSIIYNHIKLDFTCYLLNYKDYKTIKKLYADSLVLSIPEEKKEDIQQKLPL